MPTKENKPTLDVKKKELTPLERWKNAVTNLNKEIKKLDERTFRFYFFVVDTKGVPNGSLAYEYETAYQLKEFGYDVRMLYSDNEFIGVGGWLGDKYAKIPHYNIDHEGVNVAPSDFLIIPELFTNVMYKTMKFPCKRIVLLHNYGYMLDVIQPGVTWHKYGLNDCITITDTLKERIHSLFPDMRTQVVRPCLVDDFKDDGEVKKLFVNIVTKNSRDTNKIVKEFFWKYPAYQWLPIRDLKNLPREDFATALKEAFLTVWVDEETDFGYSALEAMKAGSIVIGKIPTDRPDWCKELGDDVIWFDDMNDVHEIITKVADAYMEDKMPDVLYKAMKQTVAEYTPENFKQSVIDVYIHHFVDERKTDFTNALKIAKQKVENLEKEKKEEK